VGGNRGGFSERWDLETKNTGKQSRKMFLDFFLFLSSSSYKRYDHNLSLSLSLSLSGLNITVRVLNIFISKLHYREIEIVTRHAIDVYLLCPQISSGSSSGSSGKETMRQM